MSEQWVSPEYKSWSQMIQRCYNSRCKSYPDYGGRGITADPAWRSSFKNFLSDMGRKPSPQHSLDRKDNDLGYFKDNCRWATSIEQSNNRRSNRRLEYNGETLTLMQLVRKYFPNELAEQARSRIRRRMDVQGMSLQDAMVLPAHKRYEYRGESLTLPEIVRKYFSDEPYKRAYTRLEARLRVHGYSVDLAIEAPVERHRRAA